MPETISFKVYSFEELSPDSQEKVLQECRDSYEIDCDFITEMFKVDLENEWGFTGLDNIFWRLSYCQGDGVAFYGKNINLFPIREKDETINDLLSQIESLDPEIDICLNINKSSANSHYDHYNTMIVSIEDDFRPISFEGDEIYSLLNKLQQEIQEKVKEISKSLEQTGYSDIESQTSNESMINFIISNEFKFTKDGSRKIII